MNFNCWLRLIEVRSSRLASRSQSEPDDKERAKITRDTKRPVSLVTSVVFALSFISRERGQNLNPTPALICK